MLEMRGVGICHSIPTRGDVKPRIRKPQSFVPDSMDWKILSMLQENARIANVDLAERVNLSPSPCLARVRRLEESGLISRYVTLLNSEAVGLGVSVFVQVRLERQVEATLNAFEKAVSVRSEVMECYLMTGTSDYLLRVVVSDLGEFQRFVTDLSKHAGVGNIQSSVALKQVKYKTALPLPAGRLPGSLLSSRKLGA
jgi:Lrp/AsnC family leucine-responsive transcriptional regulator